VNDLQVARIARALRHRLSLRQVDVASRASIGHDVVSRIERGRLEGLTIRTLRHVFAVFDAEVVVTVRWRGGELDRIVDRRHAAFVTAIAERLTRLEWTVAPEVSFSEYGERGSIDLLAWHAESRTVLVIEVKTELTSVEETIRRHDAKWRLAAKIARERFGWHGLGVARLLALPDERTPRRHVAHHDGVLAQAYSARGQLVRGWLAKPTGRMSGLMFLSDSDDARLRQRPGPVRRVRAGKRKRTAAELAADTPVSGT
jgi:transcriptional regulator with XRE-family HTH domain